MYIHTLLLLLVSNVLSDSLYDSSDPILELVTETFDAAVYNVKKAHFVEFYSSWCGACIGYAPTFKQFARQVESWSPIVQVTGVNCADDKNTKLCREHQVNSYPTLKYFKYNSANKDDGLLYKGDKYNIDKMATDIAGLVQADSQNLKPESWPSFTPFAEHSTVENVMNAIGSSPFLGVIVQENPAVLAWANIINFHHSKVNVVSVPPSHPIVAKHLGTGITTGALLFGVGNPDPLWTDKEVTSWVKVQEKINSVISEKLPEYVGKAPPAPNAETKTPVLPKQNQFELQLVDLRSAISYMLYKEIPRREVIQDEPLAALKHWMTTLKKYAPGTTPMRRLFYRLDEWLQLKPSISADEWLTEIDRIQQDLGNPIPKEINWIACSGSKPNLRGYTCGLWTLAHTVTVEAYNQEKNNQNFKPVIDVLEPFRAFIFHFLSCSECAQNFTKEAEKNHLQLVTRPKDVYAWLWRVHNFVNARLSGSLSDDPSYPKQQFPPKSVCPECYKNGELDEETTLEFVHSYYSIIKQDPIKPAPGYKVVEYNDGKVVAAGQRHLNPKFQVHGSKVDKLEENERMKNRLDSPQRNWREIEDEYPATPQKSHLYLIWLSIIGLALIIVYCKYRRNRSKFWKTFYYTNDFKLCPWTAQEKRNIV